MHVDVTPRRVTAYAGSPVEMLVTLTNTSDVIAGYDVRVLGADASWVTIEDPSPRLFPGATLTTRVSLTLPEGTLAGDRHFTVQVLDRTGTGQVVVLDTVVEVPAQPRTTIDVDPRTVTGGANAVFHLTVHNAGNTTDPVRLVGVDPEAQAEMTFTPATLAPAPGSSEPAVLEVRARRRWFGDPVMRPFEVRYAGPGAPGPDDPPAAAGVFVQKARIGRSALGLAGLVLAITVFAVVITVALSSVVQRSAADRRLAIEVAQARDGGVTSGRSGLAGSVVELATGAPLTGVAVDVFAADDQAQAVATTATDAAGAFAVDRLPAGEYLVRVRGAGFAEVWYPAAAAPGDAVPVAAGEGDTVTGLLVVAGGVPATIAGTVVGSDVGGATVHLEMPLDSEPLAGQVGPEPGEAPGASTGAVVRTVPVASDGTFELADVPSPAVYDVVVVKQGFATKVQRLDVAAGENRLGVELPLVLGDGTIAGTVLGPEGPLGRASVVAVSGATRLETISETAELGDEGAFSLLGLPTPGTYTVVVTADDHAAATLSFSLTQGQQLTGVDIVLGRDRGALAGRVTVEGGGDAGGVSVTVSDGATTLQTVTRSTDPVGAWDVDGLAVPGTYTLTFERTDLAQQVLSVSLDAFGQVTAGAPSADRVDVTMRSATAVLHGRVTQTLGDGSPAQNAPNVIVTLTSGTAEWRVTTASTPRRDAGLFRIEKIPPGTYTLSFARAGTRATSQIVVLTAGQVLREDAELVAPARVRGTVVQGGTPVAGRTVLLYRAAAYGTAVGALRTTTTDDDGAFDFLDVDAPDNYILEVRASAGGTILGASSPFTLDASEDAQIEIEIVP